MSKSLSPYMLSQASDLLASLMGLYFPEPRWRDLERGLNSASREFGFSDTADFINWLKTSQLKKEHIEALAGHLTIGETYFFREKETFDVIEGRVLPELICSRQDAGRRLRIWCAGCSTGEEPYSVAILLKRVIPDLEGWNITILATDINPNVLKKASEGVYTDWSFRGTPEWIRERYFRKTGQGQYEIMPEIRKMVTFAFQNLAEDAYPTLLCNTNAMDIIFCRNVLMYFSNETAGKVLRGFYNCLVDGGWLLVSPTDALKSSGSLFEVITYPGTILYRKNPEKTRIRPLPEREAAFLYDFKPAPKPADTPVLFEIPEPETIARPSGRVTEAEEVKKEEGADPYAGVLLMLEEGRYAEAAESLEEAFSKADPDARGSALLARAYANQGRLDLALEWCRKAVAAEVLNPAFHYLLAAILQEQGSAGEAIKSLRKALYLDPDFVLAYFLLGNLMLKLGEFGSAMKHFKNASTLLALSRPEDQLPESEGMTAGRLSEIIDLMTAKARA